MPLRSSHLPRQHLYILDPVLSGVAQFCPPQSLLSVDCCGKGRREQLILASPTNWGRRRSEGSGGPESSGCSRKGQEGAGPRGCRGEGVRSSQARRSPGRALAEGPAGIPGIGAVALLPSGTRTQRFMVFVPLGFDLCEVGQEEVILKTGKQANRRTMHFALQSLLALFGKQPPSAPATRPRTSLAAFGEGGEKQRMWSGQGRAVSKAPLSRA